MDLEPRKDGHFHFSLGPIEKWIAGAIAAGIVLLAYWLVSSVQTLLTQQAVTNAQLLTISVQLADVPQLSQRVGRLEVQYEAKGLQDKSQDEAIKELRQTRGLR